MFNLKEEILQFCDKCNMTGVLNGELCSCIIKFRALNRMIDNGFNLDTLKMVSDANYSMPEIENGKNFLDTYINFPEKAEHLSLYIFSKEKGWGKTTLSHYLVYKMAYHFMHTKNYSRNRVYHLERAGSILKNYKNNIKYWESSFYVLDDLGTEDRSSSWEKESFLSLLQDILHYRRDRKLSTIITSNYCPQDLSNLYDGVVDSLFEIKPDGVIGGKLFRQVEVGGGEDFRQLIEDSEWLQ